MMNSVLEVVFLSLSCLPLQKGWGVPSGEVWLSFASLELTFDTPLVLLLGSFHLIIKTRQFMHCTVRSSSFALS